LSNIQIVNTAAFVRVIKLRKNEMGGHVALKEERRVALKCFDGEI
jgi:hypothetical protein